jgi:hypothetical protein
MQRAVVTLQALHGSRVSAAVRGCAGSIAAASAVSPIGVQATLEGREVVAMEAPHPAPTSDSILAAVLRDDPFGVAVSNPSHSHGLLCAIGCAAADLIDEFITAPTERRQLR